MGETIEMGNDEFILHIRRNYPSSDTSNLQLGEKIYDYVDVLRGKADCIWLGERASHAGGKN